MRALIQRVKEAGVSIQGAEVNKIGHGLLIFLGIAGDDGIEDARYLAGKCSNLRIFSDAAGKMNLSVKDITGSVLVISQFTLYADTRKGHRPSFVGAAQPEVAEPLYEHFVKFLSAEIGERQVKAGVFRAMMDISLVNDGPVTILLDSK